ncbi:MAG: amidohydrolase family protein [Planctomycetes bacterium]|nr:amidohydrolase family protein [Planctomycetota bacterium]
MNLSLLAFLVCVPQSAPQVQTQGDAPRKNWIVSAERVYTGAGRSIEHGTVGVQGAKIGLVSNGSEDSGADVLACYAVTAGMIDASVRIDAGLSSVEQSREETPELRVTDTLSPFADAWDGQAASGVTCVLANPPDENVIGGLGAVLKTAGPLSIAERTVKADAVLRGAIGSQPSRRNHPASGRPTDFFSRRPTTRMGVEWEWRRSFYEAAASRKDASRAYIGSTQVLAALDGKLTLNIQAWTTQDIRTAVFLKEELEGEPQLGGKPRLVIDAAAEAWKEPQLLVRSKSDVVLPPFPADGRTDDGAFMAWNTAALLVSSGVRIALSAHGDSSPAGSLGMQAGYAMQGGLDFEQALAAVTTNPARMLGVEDRVGSIEVGKDADLVLWNGEPFQATSRVIGVIVDGALVLDPRAKE